GAPRLQALLVVEIVAAVEGPLHQPFAAGRDVGTRARAEGQPAGAMHLLVSAAGAAGPDAVAAIRRTVVDMLYISVEFDVRELLRRPLAVLAVLAAQQEEVLSDVEGIDAPLLLDVVQEAQRAGGV